MKILLVNKFHYHKGGSERYYFDLAKGFLDAGDSVVYFAMQSEKNLPCETQKYFVKEKNVDGSFLQKIKFIFGMNYSREAYKNMSALLREEKPDLVLLNLVHKHLTTSIIKAVKDYDKNVPVFWTMHDYIAVCPAYTMLNGRGEPCDDCIKFGAKCVVENKCIASSKLQSILAKREYDYIRKKGFYNLVDLYICPSEFMLSVLKRGNFETSKLVREYNPVLEDIKVKDAKTGGDYLLFVGRLERYKGVKVLLDALSGTSKKLIVIGDGRQRKELEKYAVEKGVNAEFLGTQNSNVVYRYMDKAKAVCIPSLWQENCPYVALESMSRATPIIASDSGGLKELVFGGENGLTFNDEQSLKCAIEKMYSLSEEEYEKMSSHCLETINKEFDMAKYVAKIKEYYKQVKDRK